MGGAREGLDTTHDMHFVVIYAKSSVTSLVILEDMQLLILGPDTYVFRNHIILLPGTTIWTNRSLLTKIICSKIICNVLPAASPIVAGIH